MKEFLEAVENTQGEATKLATTDRPLATALDVAVRGSSQADNDTAAVNEHKLTTAAQGGE